MNDKNQLKVLCDCGREIQRDSNGKAIWKHSGDPICKRCYDMDCRYETSRNRASVHVRYRRSLTPFDEPVTFSHRYRSLARLAMGLA